MDESTTEIPDPPVGLLKRGSALWAALAPARAGDPGALVLLAEACRVADRCERLDALLRGRNREWMRLVVDDRRPRTFVVHMDGALREARQQQLALRQLLAQLGVGKGDAAPAPETKGSVLDELRRRREERERGAGAG